MLNPIRSISSRLALRSVLLAAALLGVGNHVQADPYAPQPMLPPKVDYTYESGRTKGMTLFPASPVPGQPGVDPSKERKRFLQNAWLPYPGSVEHYHVFNYYHHPVPIYNYRTLVKNFPASELGGVTSQMKETFAEPVEYLRRYGPRQYTGEFRDPVSVVRLKPGQRLTFKLDPLPTSMYAVRIIGAIEPQNVTKDPKGLVVDMHINDGEQGQVSHYALRQRGTDNFYSLGEFHFHVEDARSWEVTIGLHEDSEIDLLVHNVDVHDVLGELARRAGKKRSIMAPPERLDANWNRKEAIEYRQKQEGALRRQLAELKEKHPDLSDEAIRKLYRQQTDDTLWNAMVPRNAGFINPYYRNQVLRLYGKTPGFSRDRRPDPETAVKLEAVGHTGDSKWKLPSLKRGQQVVPWQMVWEKPDGQTLTYTLDDLKAQKPLPGLPVALPPWGLRTQDSEGLAYHYNPIVEAVSSAFHRYAAAAQSDRTADAFVEYGDTEAAHQQALMLAKLAYELPSFDIIKAYNAIVVPENIYFNRTNIIQFRDRAAYQGSFNHRTLATIYDRLYPYIKDSQELADSIGRHIKWVKTPEDVITLLDTYVLQYGARQAMYMKLYYTQEQPALLSQFAALQTDPAIATPWVKAVFEWTWEYPHPYGGVEDYMYLSTQRDGTHTQGSIGYNTNGSAAARAVPYIREFIADGGDKRYDLSDFKRFPRLAQFPGWLIESRVAGLHALQIGDVGGQNIPYAQWNPHQNAAFHRGFEQTGEPRFAWLIREFGKRTTETDGEWQAILDAAQKVDRNPFFVNPSRVLTDWSAVLEGNLPADDFRLRSAARLRIGVGYGHAHADTLDLGLWAMGLTMTGDMGGRQGYSLPSGLISSSHNLVTIDNRNWMGHAWARHLNNFDTVQYTHVDTLRNGHYSRQIALVELDRGQPSPDFPQGSDLNPSTRFGKDIVNAAVYLVDFARTSGGSKHYYNFHGPQEDEFTTNLNQQDPTEGDAEFLKGYRMPDQQWVATIDQPTFIATWRMRRDPGEMEVPGRGKYELYPTEKRILDKNFDPASPRKYLRVHLPGQQEMRVLSGVNVLAAKGAKFGEWFRRVHVVRPAAQKGSHADSLFAAVYEPYAGEPFITQVKMEGDPDSSHGFAAVHVNSRLGHKDIVFSDAIAPQLRTLDNGVKVHAGFAYLSNDEQGLRKLSLAAAHELHTSDLSITVDSPYHEAKVVSLDYYNNIATMDRPMSPLLQGRFFEVGTLNKNKNQTRVSNFEVSSIQGDQLVWRKGADAGTGVIRAIHLRQAKMVDDDDADEDDDTSTPSDSPYSGKDDDDDADAKQASDKKPAQQQTTGDKADNKQASEAQATPSGQTAAGAETSVQPAAIQPEPPLSPRERYRVADNQALIELKMNAGTVSGRNYRLALTTQNPEEGYIIAQVRSRYIIVDEADLKKLNIEPGQRIRLFEIVPGDVFRTSSQLGLSRRADGSYSVQTDVPATITLKAGQAEYSTDAGQTWQKLPASPKGGWQWRVEGDLVGSQNLQLRWR